MKCDFDKQWMSRSSQMSLDFQNHRLYFSSDRFKAVISDVEDGKDHIFRP